MDHGRFLPGQFLLAMPGMGDPRFERSVIAMCVHDEQGALGICLHQPIPDLGTRDLMRQMDIEPAETPDSPVLFGGPVDMERGFVLHSTDWAGQDTRHVAGRWALTSTRDILQAIAQGRGPKSWVVALGYAGWSAGQLEAELTVNGWFTTQATEALIWRTEAETRWTSGYRLSGIDPAQLSAESGRA